MRYYTIQNNKIFIANTIPALAKFYDNVLPLPDDYEKGKYIVNSGLLVKNSNYETEKAEKERERFSKLSLTKRDVFLALYKDKRITPEMIKSKICDPESIIEFEYANEYFRGNPLVSFIGADLDYTSEELDYLFQNKKLPVKEEIEEKDV